MPQYSVTRIEYDEEFFMGSFDSKEDACQFANTELLHRWCMYSGLEELGDEYHLAIESDRKPYAWCLINKVTSGYLVKEF